MRASCTAALSLAAALTILIVSVAAQQPTPQPAPGPPPAKPEDQPPGGGQPPVPRAPVPAAASSIAAKPEAFYGQYVTIYATVEKSLTPLAFTVDQDTAKSTGKEVIVIAPRLHEPVEPNTYVTVMGEVVAPDAAEITKKSKWAANGVDDILAKNPGRPVILATAVITTAFNDLAKFLPPPMTPEEAMLDKTMKVVGPANGALRKGIEAANVALVKTNTAILIQSFTDLEAFWKTRDKADAVKMAQAARIAVQGIETAAAVSNWGDVKTHATTLAQQCSSCHGIYRERLEDGSFALKRGVK